MPLQRKNFIIPGFNDRPMAADLTLPAASGAVPLVAYLHGINGFKDWGGMDLVATAFAEEGFAFLKFNFSHNGTTPENPVEFTDLKAYGQDNYSIRQEDIRKVVDFALGMDESWERIALLGHSRGGTDAILYAPHDLRIASLVSWAAVSEASTPWRSWDSDKMEDWKTKGVQYLENGRTGQLMPLYYQLYEDARANRQRLEVEKAARSIQIPWLIAHGDDDESVFVKAAYDLKSWRPEASVDIIENTGHTFGRSHPWEESELPEASQKLVKQTLKFLKT